MGFNSGFKGLITYDLQLYHDRSQKSEVGTVTSIQEGGSGVRILAGERNILLLREV